MEIVKLEAHKREQIGKKATKAVRNGNLVPCNLYGGGENISFTVEYNPLKKEFIQINSRYLKSV